jgi:hypothetical protein
MCIFVLCLIVVPLPLDRNPFTAKLNNNKNNNNNNSVTQQHPQSTVFKAEELFNMLVRNTGIHLQDYTLSQLVIIYSLSQFLMPPHIEILKMLLEPIICCRNLIVT